MDGHTAVPGYNSTFVAGKKAMESKQRLYPILIEYDSITRTIRSIMCRMERLKVNYLRYLATAMYSNTKQMAQNIAVER